jgi:hypothetical protein
MATQKSIDESAGVQQIGQCAEAHGVGTRRGRREAGPWGRHERATPVWEDKDQMQLTAAMGPAQQGQRLAFKRMTRPGDRDGRREVFEVGSMRQFPSTPSTTGGW